MAGGTVEVHDELYSHTKYADRHTIDITKTDGSTVRMEVYVFGDLSTDGRFNRIDETTMLLQGDETDRNLGSAR